MCAWNAYSVNRKKRLSAERKMEMFIERKKKRWGSDLHRVRKRARNRARKRESGSERERKRRKNQERESLR